ncbi:MAG: hypothetical protein HY907_05410 [Deltaproteobacteria bacterium]|nr:hypothetical protein [Deltaproteobacteria bacterium]
MAIHDATRCRLGPSAALLALGLALPWAAGCGESAPSCPTLDAADDGAGGDGEAGADADADADTDADADADSEVAAATCGNGALEPGEECDLAELGGATCASLGRTPGTLACGDDCRYDTAGCAVCGDGRCEAGETPLTCAAECAVADVAAGAVHTCAVLADGSVRCWGARDGHQLGGVGDVSRPVRVPGIDDATKVAAGEGHTCVAHEDGTVSCWGRSGFGECRSIAARVWPPAVVTELTGVTALAAGAHHTCAILGDGTASCWGRSDFGNLGNGTHPARSATPQAVTGLSGVTTIAAGAQHTCVAASSGVSCWGRNDVGQVGGNDRNWHDLPERPVTGGLRAFGVGNFHGCACIMMPSWPPSAQGLYCWGNNAYGQLGVAPSPDALSPTHIDMGCPQVLEGGDAFTCSIPAAPGPVLCWGGNSFGQLGDGTQLSRHATAEVLDVADAVQLSAGASHVCARLADGTLRCWGRNVEGQVGGGTSARHLPYPVEPVGL